MNFRKESACKPAWKRPTLSAQTANADRDAAITVQRGVADEIDRQLADIDWVIATCAHVERIEKLCKRGAP